MNWRKQERTIGGHTWLLLRSFGRTGPSRRRAVWYAGQARIGNRATTVVKHRKQWCVFFRIVAAQEEAVGSDS